MNYPFLTSYNNKSYVKLHRSLYDEQVIMQAKKDEPQTVIAVDEVKDYYLVELKPDSEDDYFDFLNFLISAKRNQ